MIVFVPQIPKDFIRCGLFKDLRPTRPPGVSHGGHVNEGGLLVIAHGFILRMWLRKRPTDGATC